MKKKTIHCFFNTGMSIKGRSDDFKKRAKLSSFPDGGSLRPLEPIFFSYHMQIKSNNPECAYIFVFEMSVSVGSEVFTALYMKSTVLWFVTVLSGTSQRSSGGGYHRLHSAFSYLT
jgi:hypothetical protein